VGFDAAFELVEVGAQTEDAFDGLGAEKHRREAAMREANWQAGGHEVNEVDWLKINDLR